ncbi:hypothetical protein [Arcobacter sp.]|uniref:hypothetical protein n=1 Tax=Arcobacter sp. TaxID=1872629 RepID=UPI003D09BD64
MAYINLTRDHSVRNIVNIEGETKKKEVWKLGSISNIQGSDYIMMPLYSNQNYSIDSYTKSALSSVRNYLFFDTEGNKKYWLFPNNDYLVAQTTLLPNASFGEQLQDTKAILYYVVKSDTNKDKSLTAMDFKTIAISKPDGTKYTELLGEIDFVNGYKVNGDNSVVIIYQRKNIGYSARINLSTFVVSDESKLPSVNQ